MGKSDANECNENSLSNCRVQLYTLISLTNQFDGIDFIYNDFLIGVIQRFYESIDLIVEGIEIHQIDDNKALLDNTRAQTSKIVPTTLITA